MILIHVLGKFKKRGLILTPASPSVRVVNTKKVSLSDLDNHKKELFGEIKSIKQSWYRWYGF